MRYRHDPDGLRLPIKLDTASNGEFVPVPLGPFHEAAIAHAHTCVSDNARRRGVGRREFLVSTCGAATALLALNDAHARQGRTGGYFDLPRVAGVDRDVAAATLEGNEFIFDVQNHHVNALGRWRNPKSGWMRGLKNFPNASCAHDIGEGEYAYVNCFNGENYIKDVFLDSDTQMAVMSMVPSTHEDAPLTIEEADATRALVAKLGNGARLLLHGKVNPNLPGDMERMEELKSKWGYSDPRLNSDMQNCDICGNDVFRSTWRETGVQRRAFDAPPPMGLPAKAAGIDQDALVKTITDRVLAALGHPAA